MASNLRVSADALVEQYSDYAARALCCGSVKVCTLYIDRLHYGVLGSLDRAQRLDNGQARVTMIFVHMRYHTFHHIVMN